MIDAAKLKMYILVADDIPVGHAINSAAHASLACYLKFQDVPLMKMWEKESFKKVTCKVTRQQLSAANTAADELIMHKKVITESALHDVVTAIAFCPRETWPDWMAALPLYK